MSNVHTSLYMQSDLNIVARLAVSRETDVDTKGLRMEEEDKAMSLEIAEEMVRRSSG